MKDEKQELLRVIEELRTENGNLQVRRAANMAAACRGRGHYCGHACGVLANQGALSACMMSSVTLFLHPCNCCIGLFLISELCEFRTHGERLLAALPVWFRQPGM